MWTFTDKWLLHQGVYHSCNQRHYALMPVFPTSLSILETSIHLSCWCFSITLYRVVHGKHSINIVELMNMTSLRVVDLLGLELGFEPKAVQLLTTLMFFQPMGQREVGAGSSAWKQELGSIDCGGPSQPRCLEPAVFVAVPVRLPDCLDSHLESLPLLFHFSQLLRPWQNITFQEAHCLIWTCEDKGSESLIDGEWRRRCCCVSENEMCEPKLDLWG